MILFREEDRAAAERRKKKLLAVYILIACVYLAAALVLLILSPEEYRIYQIADIALTVAFAWYSIYFFTVLYDAAWKRVRLLDKVASALTEREYGVFLREEEPKTVDGMEMRILIFRILDAEREVRLPEGDLSLKAGCKYLLEIRAGILTEIGGTDE